MRLERWSRRWVSLLLAACLASLGVTGLPSAIAQQIRTQDFETGLGGWVVLGDKAQVGLVHDPAWVNTGRAALAYNYSVDKGVVHVLVLPVTTGSLSKVQTLSLAVKSSVLANVAISLEEQGGGRWTAPVSLPAGKWTELTLRTDDFALATGEGDPSDPNGRLDMDRVRQLTVVDVGAMLAGQSADMARMFGIQAGTRRLAIDNLTFGNALATTARPGGLTRRLDRFDEPVLHSMVLGASQVTLERGAPLTQPGLSLIYAKGPGAVMSWIQPVKEGELSGAQDIRLQLASRMKSELVLKLEQANGDKFQTSLEVAGDGKLKDYTLPIKQFERADDSRSRAKTPDMARVNQVVLMDIGGWFASKGDNRLAVQQLSASGASPQPAKMAVAPSKAAAPEMVNVDTPGWSRWSKRIQPIYSGPFSLIGDPSVFKDGSIYRMFYTCFEPNRKGPAICQATSPDGLNWSDVSVKGSVPGLMVSARPGKWDDAHETAFAMKWRGQYWLYFVGYRDRGGFAKSFPAFLGLATSTDGVNFERSGDEPILKPTPGWYDNEAVFSPSIVEHNGELVMIYTGHCWTNCTKGKGVFLLAATSTDGRNWVKKPQPILSKIPLPKAKDGSAEAEVVKGPDGQFYLFMSLLYGDDQGHEIGVAKSASPFGPWDINPEAIIRRSVGEFDDVGPIAPAVLIEGGKARMWFHGFSKRNTIQIGYAEAPWPLRLQK